MAADYPTTVPAYGLNKLGKAGSLQKTTITGAISAGALSFELADANAQTTWPTANFYARLDSEIVFCDSRSGTTVTVNASGRGVNGTTAASHALGATVRVVAPGVMLEKIQDELVAIGGWPRSAAASFIKTPVTTTPYVPTTSDWYVPMDATAANATVNLPTAVGIKGRSYFIKKTDATANTVTVDASGAQTIDGALTVVLADQFDAIEIVSDGANWHVISQPGVGVIQGTGAAGKVAFWSASTTLTSETTFAWDNTNKRLGVGTATPSSLLHTDSGTRNFGSTNAIGILSEASGISTDTVTAASGTRGEAHFHLITAGTIAATNATVTVTDAATFVVGSVPTAGTNVTITNAWAAWFKGSITVDNQVLVQRGTAGVPAFAFIASRVKDPDTGIYSPGANRLGFTTNGTARGEFDATGNFILGIGALTTTATDGFPYIPGMAGKPTGTPTTATGRVPLTVDTTNNIVYYYNAAWKPIGGLFDAAASRTSSTWINEGPLLWSIITDGPAEGPRYIFPGVNATTARVAEGRFRVLDSTAVAPGTEETAWDAGDILEYVALIEIPSFSTLGANQLMGIILNASGAPSQMTKTDTGARIVVGVDSAGDVFLITSDGVSVTSTDTGANYTAGNKVKIYVKFTKGTNVVCKINDANETTVALTLPTSIAKHGHGKGTTSDSRDIPKMYGGYWKFTEA